MATAAYCGLSNCNAIGYQCSGRCFQNCDTDYELRTVTCNTIKKNRKNITTLMLDTRVTSETLKEMFNGKQII